MELQELVARARIIFQGAPKRAQVFELVNGKRSAKEIARRSRKSLSAALQDLQKMRDMELVVPKKNDGGKLLKRDNSVVYEKHPLLKHLSKNYFEDPTQLPQPKRNKVAKKRALITSIKIPNEQEVLDICRSGEDQLYEFKSAGTDARTISKEVGAFANTKMGGIIFYGVQDDGSIENADVRRQVFDQRTQNSIRNTISPAISVKIVEKDVLGHKIFLILIPAWNRKNVYQYEQRVYLRHGTNVFAAKPEESRQLHNGKIVV
ncbi:MAG: hypothetical protein UW97_C0008G0011 [Parcubacteria group bacterium GW2011_GWA2_45_15]|nr:MAG: hypothetical protein UW97_C0008G0011 [Parcubacteria group bacterium GW2011_GWA2_45_15]